MTERPSGLPSPEQVLELLGDEFAHSLGFAVHRERLMLFAAMAFMTSASVALGGTIGFIGLLMPHIVRFLLGADSRHLVPASAVAGTADSPLRWSRATEPGQPRRLQDAR